MARLQPQLKMFCHAERVKQWLAGIQPVPILVEIDPVAYCNANCPWCFYAGQRGGSKISREALTVALRAMACGGVRAINWTGGGEPTLHPDFNSFVDTAHKWGLRRQGLFTNAISEEHGVNPERFDWIRVSLTEQYMDGISKPLLARYCEDTTVGICLNLTVENFHKANGLCREAKQLGVDYFQVRPALARSWEGQEWVAVPVGLKQYEDDTFKVYLSEYKFVDSISPKTYDVCRAGQFTPVIDYDGNVRVCNYHLGDDSYIIGNIGEESFSDIARRIPRETPVAENCQNCCKNHELNKLLDELVSIQDPDFI